MIRWFDDVLIQPTDFLSFDRSLIRQFDQLIIRSLNPFVHLIIWTFDKVKNWWFHCIDALYINAVRDFVVRSLEFLENIFICLYNYMTSSSFVWLIIRFFTHEQIYNRPDIRSFLIWYFGHLVIGYVEHSSIRPFGQFNCVIF